MNHRNYAIMSIIAASALFGVLFAATAQPYLQPQEERLAVHGFFTFKLYDQYGNLKQTLITPNTVVDSGLDCLGDLVFGTTACTGEAFFNYIQIGTGTTGPTSSDTALEIPIGGCSRIQDGSVALASPTGEITATIDVTFSGATCAAAVTEAGVFDASTSGNMLARKTFAAINIGSSDSLEVTYNIKVEMV